MFELAALVAWDEWVLITKEYAKNGANIAIQSFIESPKSSRENNCYKVRAITQQKHLDDIPGLLDVLGGKKAFELSQDRGFYQIDFIYCPTLEDYKYLMLHRDQFWLAKKRSIIEFILPIIIGFVAVLLLINNVTSLLLVS